MYCCYHIIIAAQVLLFVFMVDSGFVELCLVPFIIFEEKTGLKVIKLEFILRLKIKRNDCNHRILF